jgi:hypothetical protein
MMADVEASRFGPTAALPTVYSTWQRQCWLTSDAGGGAMLLFIWLQLVVSVAGLILLGAWILTGRRHNILRTLAGVLAVIFGLVMLYNVVNRY